MDLSNMLARPDRDRLARSHPVRRQRRAAGASHPRPAAGAEAARREPRHVVVHRPAHRAGLCAFCHCGRCRRGSGGRPGSPLRGARDSPARRDGAGYQSAAAPHSRRRLVRLSRRRRSNRLAEYAGGAGGVRGAKPLVMFGLALAIPLLALGSAQFINILRKTPLLWASAALLGWVAGKMAAADTLVAASFMPPEIMQKFRAAGGSDAGDPARLFGLRRSRQETKKVIPQSSRRRAWLSP